MKRFGKIAVGLAGGLALNAGLFAEELSSTNNPLPGDPYAPIVVRNIFGLNPPAPPSDPNAILEASLPKITPTGVYSVFGHWKVLFKASGSGKPGQPAKDVFYNLTEGQRQDDIEVTHIDAENSLVTFNNHTVVQELPLVKVAASGGTAPAVGAGNPGRPTFTPGGNNNNSGGPGGGIIRFGGRGAGFGGPNRGGNGGNLNAGAGAPGGANGGLNFGDSGGSSRVYQPEASQMTPEQTALIIEAQRAKYQQEGDPTAKLLPVTPLTQFNTPDDNAPPAP